MRFPVRLGGSLSPLSQNAGKYRSRWSRICPAAAGHGAWFPVGEPWPVPPRWTRAFYGTTLPTLVNEVPAVVPMESGLLRFAGSRGPFAGTTTGAFPEQVDTCISEHGRLAGYLHSSRRLKNREFSKSGDGPLEPPGPRRRTRAAALTSPRPVPARKPSDFRPFFGFSGTGEIRRPDARRWPGKVPAGAAGA